VRRPRRVRFKEGGRPGVGARRASRSWICEKHAAHMGNDAEHPHHPKLHSLLDPLSWEKMREETTALRIRASCYHCGDGSGDKGRHRT